MNRWLLTRRHFMEAAALTTAGLCLDRAEAHADFVIAPTVAGKLRGSREDGICVFRGVPYGGSVDGPNRFKEAPPLESWPGVRDALRLGPPAMQPEHTYYGENEPAPQENCLVLNLWTPAIDRKRRAVMFYSHGGGFSTGSAGAVAQDGANLARAYDVVVVSSNHRLGLLGFLRLAELAGGEYHTSGNQGILDIQMALRWVQANIASFGGDPANVMLFGESGGALKTACLYSMPSAAPLFAKASMESGPGIRMTKPADAAELTRRVLDHLGLKPAEWRRLLTVPAARLLEAQRAVEDTGTNPNLQFDDRLGLSMGATRFAPVVDGAILPQHPFDPVAPACSKHKPLIIGTNRDEMNFIFWMSKADVWNLSSDTLRARLLQELGSRADEVLKTYSVDRPGASPTDLYIAITTDRMWRLGSITIAERKYEQRGAPVFMYLFTHQSNYLIPGTTRPMGAGHATDIAYTFDNVHDPARRSKPVHVESHNPLGEPMIIGTDAERLAVAHHKSEMWATFAKTGAPGARGQPQWPPYVPPERATMMIDAQCVVQNDPHRTERELWSKLDPLPRPV